MYSYGADVANRQIAAKRQIICMINLAAIYWRLADGLAWSEEASMHLTPTKRHACTDVHVRKYST
jgi:hypothetical protein